ncbi:hypothetical protein DRQ09_06520 [candidate division KSB1 bacterium]|nr:MAG: hypothetical protein DRQ09_06520 [candidate division KSB1 bacterium]
MKKKLKRYSRQILIEEIGEKGQEKLLSSSVAVVGCGALGTFTAENLVRAGVGIIKIIDRDFPEISNLHRQLLYDENDVKKKIPKAVSAAKKLKKMNSTVMVEPFPDDLNVNNIDEILTDVDIIFDGTDNFETRFLINDYCLKNNIPWIYTSAVSTFGMTMNIIPGKTPCLRCIINDLPVPGSVITCETAGILGVTAYFISSIEVIEGIKIILNKNNINKYLIVVDVWKEEIDKIEVNKDKNCPVCSGKKYEFLKKKRKILITGICGMNKFYITPWKPQKISFERIAERLKSVGKVTYNNYLLKVTLPEYQIVLFADGRVSIEGVKDEKEAKSIYSRLFGC